MGVIRYHLRQILIIFLLKNMVKLKMVNNHLRMLVFLILMLIKQWRDFGRNIGRVGKARINTDMWRNYSIFLCKFAQENVTEDKILETKSNEILSALYNMSNFSYDLWMDNLILKINE